jgi:hypothetical protein
VVLRPDGLGVASFGATQRQALGALRAKLGRPDETGSWKNGSTPFGICPGATRAVRWGRLYVLFTNGPTRYAAAGRWHLFAYQVDAVQRTVAELRAAYGGRLRMSYGEPGMVHRFRVRFGAGGELSGGLSGGTPTATVTGLAAGARCGE